MTRTAGDFRPRPILYAHFILTTDRLLTAFSMVSAEFADRPLKKLCLFDVDGTLTLARQVRAFFRQHRVCTNHFATEGISRND